MWRRNSAIAQVSRATCYIINLTLYSSGPQNLPEGRVQESPTLTACPKSSASPQNGAPPWACWGRSSPRTLGLPGGLPPGSASQPHPQLTRAAAPVAAAGLGALADPDEDTLPVRQDSQERPSWE